MRRESPSDPPEWVKKRELFIRELQKPIVGDHTLTSLLFVMLLSFCNGSMPHYPVKKILILIWKSILAMMGAPRKLFAVKIVIIGVHVRSITSGALSLSPSDWESKSLETSTSSATTSTNQILPGAAFS